MILFLGPGSSQRFDTCICRKNSTTHGIWRISIEKTSIEKFTSMIDYDAFYVAYFIEL